MRYKASLDNLARSITIAITVLFVILIAIQISIIKNIGYGLPVLTIGFLLLIYFIAFAYRPISYIVTMEELIILRPISSVRLLRADIKSVEIIERKVLSHSLRTWGVGGMFGYFGKFIHHKLGAMTWYATRWDKAVLITTNENKRIVLTPNDFERFVAEF